LGLIFLKTNFDYLKITVEKLLNLINGLFDLLTSIYEKHFAAGECKAYFKGLLLVNFFNFEIGREIGH
jgi:hypothetical protein